MQLLQIRQPNGRLHAANATEHASNVQTKEKLMTMEAKIKKLAATIAAMTTSMTNNKNRDPNGFTNRGGGSNHVARRPQMIKIHNMGAYCSLHGFHPVGAHHDSTNCTWTRPKHNSTATWNNRLGGDTYWLHARQVAIGQQDHPMWKGKSAPTN
jgi:hypothetical protein